MEVVENEDNVDSIITLEDFPFICRICCLTQSDMRLFEEEDYLLDLFHSIQKIDVNSRVEFPRNICNECVVKLEELSLFIDISKYNDASFLSNTAPTEDIIEYADDVDGVMTQKSIETSEKGDEDMSLQKSQKCRICSSPASTLTPFKEKIRLMQLFQNITNIDVNAESKSSENNSICKQCNDELEKISSFVTLLLCNAQKLDNAIDRSENVKTENYSDSIDVEISTCQNVKLGNVIGGNEVLTECTSREMALVHGNEATSEIIDVKKEVIDNELSAFAKQSDQNELEFNHGVLPEEDAFEDSLLKKILLANSSKKLRNLGDEKYLTSGKKSFVCDCCNKSFICEQNLKRHMPIHTGEKPFVCEICERPFTAKRYLQQHMHTHTGEKQFRCDRCGKRYSEKRTLEYHLFNKHGKKPFICKTCKKNFYLRSNLKQHMLTDHGGKPYKCDSCENSFKRMAHLKQHLRVHSGEKPFKCDCCDKSFGQTASLNQHMLTHTREKPFKCGCCEKSFTRETTLRTHLLTLAVRKPFQCDLCKRRFAQQCDLKHHMLGHTENKKLESSWRLKGIAQKLTNRTLTAERPFKCDHCNKCFTQKGHLTLHMITHSELRPHNCDYCEKSFKRKDHLRRHMERNHSHVSVATEVSEKVALSAAF